MRNRCRPNPIPLALTLAALSAATAAQAQLPATAPTALPAGGPAAPLAAAAAPGTTDSRPHRPHVSFSGGLLDVRADNSSLNDILYEVGKATGMRITGGVIDQRVFGNYGPAAPSVVLATLIDGTGANMLLREGPDGTTPVELVLTPRTGGPSPASPSAPHYADEVESGPPHAAGLPPGVAGTPPVQVQPGQPSTTRQPGSVPPAVPQPLNNPLGSPDSTTNTAATMPTTNSVPTDTLPVPSTAQETKQGIVDSPNPPPPGSTTSTSPNAVATPEQIYQQLLKLQQQNGSSSASPAPSTAPQTPAH